jgi:hypothetical protein
MALLLGTPLLGMGSASAWAASCGPSAARLIVGPRGGCYYINRNGNKTYVARSCCH